MSPRTRELCFALSVGLCIAGIALVALWGLAAVVTAALGVAGLAVAGGLPE